MNDKLLEVGRVIANGIYLVIGVILVAKDAITGMSAARRPIHRVVGNGNAMYEVARATRNDPDLMIGVGTARVIGSGVGRVMLHGIAPGVVVVIGHALVLAF